MKVVFVFKKTNDLVIEENVVSVCFAFDSTMITYWNGTYGQFSQKDYELKRISDI